MRRMDSLGLKICSFQATLFEKSLDLECSTPIFVRRFMNSDLAVRMDNDGFGFESITITDAIDEIEEQYGSSSYGVNKYSSEELHWIGYIYRYWSYVTGKTSNQLYKSIKPNELKKLYYPYHSLDPLQAIERIQESIEPEEYRGLDDIARGVIILRKVRNKHKARQLR